MKVIEVTITADELGLVPASTTIAQYVKERLAAADIPVMVSRAPGFTFTAAGHLHIDNTADAAIYQWTPSVDAEPVSASIDGMALSAAGWLAGYGAQA